MMTLHFMMALAALAYTLNFFGADPFPKKPLRIIVPVALGATPMLLSPIAFKARIESDRVRYAKVIKEGNVQVD